MKPSELLQRIVKAEQIADKGALYELGRELDQISGLAETLRRANSDLQERINFRDWTPTLTQGVAITRTIFSARYFRLNNLVVASCELQIGSAGTATQSIVLSGLPARIRYSTWNGIGFFTAIDNGTTNYDGTLFSDNASNVSFGVSGFSGKLGTAPAWTLANTDFISGTLLYEAAP